MCSHASLCASAARRVPGAALTAPDREALACSTSGTGLVEAHVRAAAGLLSDQGIGGLFERRLRASSPTAFWSSAAGLPSSPCPPPRRWKLQHCLLPCCLQGMPRPRSGRVRQPQPQGCATALACCAKPRLCRPAPRRSYCPDWLGYCRRCGSLGCRATVFLRGQQALKPKQARASHGTLL
jgi:hypothetical protein